MKYGVTRNTLLKTAGLIWLIAGLNILRIGLECWSESSQPLPLQLGEATLIFFLFAGFIFQKIYKKHTMRISNKESEKNCPFSFFDLKGWGIMVFMITLGIITRKFQLLSNSVIAVFYTGLALALIITGIRFIIYRKHKLS